MQQPNRQRPTQQRSRGQAQAPAQTQAGWGHSVETMEQDSKSHFTDDKRLPFSFSMKPNNSARIVLLDASIKGVAGTSDHGLWLMHEHVFSHPVTGKWPIYETCPQNIDGYCPLCAGEVTGTPDQSKYHLVMSVIDMTPYTDREGNVRTHSRKLIRFKSSKKAEHDQILKIMDTLNGIMEEHGSLHGVMLNMVRPDDKMSPSHGAPSIIPKSGGRTFAKIPDAKFAEKFNHPEIMSKDGKTVIYRANEMTEPFDYVKFFPKPSAADIAQRWNLPDRSQGFVPEKSLIEGNQSSYETMDDMLDTGTAKEQQADQNGFDFDDDFLNEQPSQPEQQAEQQTSSVEDDVSDAEDGFDDDMFKD